MSLWWHTITLYIKTLLYVSPLGYHTCVNYVQYLVIQLYMYVTRVSTEAVEKIREQLWELVLSSTVGSGDQTRVSRPL